MAIIAKSKRGRVYLPPNPEHEKIAAEAKKAEVVAQARATFLSEATPTRAMVTGGVCSAYGLATWGHLFTPRQLVALTTFSDLVLEARAKVLQDASAAGMDPDPTPLADGGTGAQAYADAVSCYLSLSIGRLADLSSALASWIQELEAVRNTFARQALPMAWGFC